MQKVSKQEIIVQLLYRRIKKLPLTAEENEHLDSWLTRSESNRTMFENLTDDAWMAKARERYFAPGKEEGLQQLRGQLFDDQYIVDHWGKLGTKISADTPQEKRSRQQRLLIFTVFIIIFLICVAIVLFRLSLHII